MTTNEELIAEARLWPRDGVNEGRLINALADALEAATRERDAALAALEHVRAIHAPEVVGIHEGYGEEVWCPTCKHHYPCPTAVALDGAPEPEEKP